MKLLDMLPDMLLDAVEEVILFLFGRLAPVSYTHLTLPTIYSV